MTLRGHRDHIADLAFRGDLLVSGGGDAKVKQWSLRRKQCIATHDHSLWVGSVALSADAVLSASGDCTVKVWRVLTGTETRESGGSSGALFTLRHDTCIQGVAVDAVEGVLVATISGDAARVWSLRTGECYSTIGGSPPHNKGTFHSVALRGNLLAAGSGDWRIRLWSLACASRILGLDDGRTACVLIGTLTCVSGVVGLAISPLGFIVSKTRSRSYERDEHGAARLTVWAPNTVDM